jgi:hypothetical protein
MYTIQSAGTVENAKSSPPFGWHLVLPSWGYWLGYLVFLHMSSIISQLGGWAQGGNISKAIENRSCKFF